MFLNLKNKLKKMGPKSLTQAEKNILWSKIERGIESGQKQPSYFQQPSIFFGLSRRFAFASFLIFALVGGSAATVIASDSAKPGDTLFPIDIAAEAEARWTDHHRAPLPGSDPASQRSDERE